MSADEVSNELSEEYPEWQQIACSRQASIFYVALLQLCIIFKKQLAEFKFLGYVFLAIVVTFIGLLIAELYLNQDDVAKSFNVDDLLSVKTDYHLVTSVCILVFAFSVQVMTFPTYVELEKRSTARF